MTSYALPISALPQTSEERWNGHMNGHSHAHSHSHSQPHTPPSLGSLAHARTPRSARSNSSKQGYDDHDHGHNHVHDHDHEKENRAHNGAQHRANSNHSIQARPKLPLPLSSPNGWKTVSTAAGKAVTTPTHGTFEQTYEAPAQSILGAHNHSSVPRSAFTKFLLPYTARYPVLHAIMAEKDSRRIFYFMSLNFSFMAVQAFYGYVTDSLGLLSDSIHMFFDCVALAVGLFAAVASKWPPNERFPYGFGKIETLSGFANGIFLMLISVEIMFEACERIVEGRQTKRLGELFVVSTLGGLVNLVGMTAFGHHHHGHSHGHDHGHDHSHDHQHDHGNSHSHGHSHGDNHAHDKDHERHAHNHSREHGSGHSHGDSHHGHHHHHHHQHGHSHDNENMQGIYLHILADTLGSAAVIASTVLTHLWPWAGWDPLASFLIAVLILLSAIPLVKSSARRLLLTIPDGVEYNLRETLSGVPGLQGVVSYAAPKFWIDDRSGAEDKLLGIMHVMAARGADPEDVRDRVRNYLLERGIDITLQVEREGEANCWCNMGRSPLSGTHGPSASVHF